MSSLCLAPFLIRDYEVGKRFQLCRTNEKPPQLSECAWKTKQKNISLSHVNPHALSTPHPSPSHPLFQSSSSSLCFAISSPIIDETQCTKKSNLSPVFSQIEHFPLDHTCIRLACIGRKQKKNTHLHFTPSSNLQHKPSSDRRHFFFCTSTIFLCNASILFQRNKLIIY